MLRLEMVDDSIGSRQWILSIAMDVKLHRLRVSMFTNTLSAALKSTKINRAASRNTRFLLA